MKKTLTLSLALLAYVNSYAVNVYGFKGTGTSSDPYQISSAADFGVLAEKITQENTGSGECFVLTSDIDFGGKEECPVQFPSIARGGIGGQISKVNWGFQGVLDGKNHIISGIYHTNCGNDDSGKFNALISSLGVDGVVKNLVFSEDNYIKSYNYAAPFVSVNKGGLIENCVNHADIVAVSSFAAGICGYIVAANGTVYNCINYGKIVAMTFASGIISGSYSGPTIGTSDSDYTDIIIDKCVNYGDISTTNGVGSAGIAGSYSGVITNCSNYGAIDDSEGTASNRLNTAGIVANIKYVGGLGGNVNNGTVKGVKYVGGIVGCVGKASDEFVSIYNNYNYGEITGSSFVGDIIGCSQRTQTIATAIGTIETSPVPAIDAPCYNIMGQRVSRNTKGVVIVNGKKILNR